MPEMQNELGCIYVIRMGPYFKIGKTVDREHRPFEIVRRLNKMEPRLPYDAEPMLFLSCFLKDLDRVERQLHEHFSLSRMRGEWFMLSPEDRQWIVFQGEIPVWINNCDCDCDTCRDFRYVELEQIPSPS
jgi:hypothetical protein